MKFSGRKKSQKPTGAIVLILANVLAMSGCLRATEIQQHNKAHSVHVDMRSEQLKGEHTPTPTHTYP